MSRAVPAGVLLACALVVHLVFALLVLPRFAGMFRDFGAQLPWPTRMVCSPLWSIGWGAWLVLVGGLAVVQAAGRRPPVLLLAVLSTTAISWIATILAVYLPIFSIAGAIHE